MYLHLLLTVQQLCSTMTELPAPDGQAKALQVTETQDAR